MKKTIISMISVVLCGVIMFSVGMVMGKNDSQSGNITFVTENVKKQWESPVEKLIAELKNQDVDGMITASAHAFGLFDVNLDGTPELIRVLPGGSAGNVFCEAYDIYSGECIGTFGSGWFDSDLNGGWCTYYKRDTQEFINIGIDTTRGGADARFKNISCIVFDEETECYDEKSMLYSAYRIETTIVDNELVENGINVEFKADNNDVSLDEYINASDYFLKNYVRVDETTMYFVRVADVNNKEDRFAKEMTQALFENSQKFVADNTRD